MSILNSYYIQHVNNLKCEFSWVGSSIRWNWRLFCWLYWFIGFIGFIGFIALLSIKMPNFRDIRNVLLVAMDDGYLSDDEFGVMLPTNPEIITHTGSTNHLISINTMMLQRGPYFDFLKMTFGDWKICFVCLIPLSHTIEWELMASKHFASS